MKAEIIPTATRYTLEIVDPAHPDEAARIDGPLGMLTFLKEALDQRELFQSALERIVDLGRIPDYIGCESHRIAREALEAHK